MGDEKPETSMISTSYDQQLVPVLETPEERARSAEVTGRRRSANTRRNYRGDWLKFQAWCTEKSVDPLRVDVETVRIYLLRRLETGLSVGAAERAYAAIVSLLEETGAPGWKIGFRPQAIREFFRNVAEKYSRPVVKKRPLLPEHFKILADPARFDGKYWIRSARNRALLLVGFGAALRRSELVGLDVEHCLFDPRGVQLFLPVSKTDQARKGRLVALARAESGDRCPVKALEVWLEGARIASGAVFRALLANGALSERRLCDDAVALVVKEAVAALGLDPKVYAGHSLRIGHVTTAARQGRSLDEIMRTTGHKSTQQVLDYIQTANPYDRVSSKGILDDDGEKKPR